MSSGERGKAGRRSEGIGESLGRSTVYPSRCIDRYSLVSKAFPCKTANVNISLYSQLAFAVSSNHEICSD